MTKSYLKLYNDSWSLLSLIIFDTIPFTIYCVNPIRTYRYYISKYLCIRPHNPSVRISVQVFFRDGYPKCEKIHLHHLYLVNVYEIFHDKFQGPCFLHLFYRKIFLSNYQLNCQQQKNFHIIMSSNPSSLLRFIQYSCLCLFMWFSVID